MPKRTDLQSILILGAGPIVIGQACEFDYSGVQACKALKAQGYRIILVNSNPATIMTDPELADATYIEPVQWQSVANIIAKERPDALLPTMGGQTALNCALDLANQGVLEKFAVEIIGATADAIDKAENRSRFDQAMKNIGLETPNAYIAHSLDQAYSILENIGFPAIIRPSFTSGGTGGGIAYNREEFATICLRGLDLSPTKELLIDQSLIGWKEFEMEVVRDRADNCIIVCTIENIDPMGVHTGDSITVAPAQTLTDKEFQFMRNAAIAVLREIGVETGGSNVQFGVCPNTGRMVVIEMNPRVSRSSALASKATGFPIAKIAALLAVGFTLDELSNDMTDGKTPASFEPSIDYVVTKFPRFNFEKFAGSEDRLTTQMKSVGEVMSIGRNFQESLQKAIRSLEVGMSGFEPVIESDVHSHNQIIRELKEPGAQRLWFIAEGFRSGLSLDAIFELTQIDPWFLAQIEQLIELEQQTSTQSLENITPDSIYKLKRKGFSDQRLAQLLQCKEQAVQDFRATHQIQPVFKRVDTCAAEFASETTYFYSSYDQHCEALPTQRESIIVLGGGPNRIGQGIEFDYCCVHAIQAIHELGYDAIMVNCNPETVSTDYDTSDRLYFEPITLEDVLTIVAQEQPAGVIIQFGGQTPLKLAQALSAQGVNILGTSPDAIDRAEDRERFQQMIINLGLKQPHNAIVSNLDQALIAATQIGFPLVVRPSYVLGGRAMEIVYGPDDLTRYMLEAVSVSNESPILLDRFLDDAIEVDVDIICDGEQVFVGGIMEHIEQAGIHSGDSACSLPPHSLSDEIQQQLTQQVQQLALELGVVGLMNTQFAIQRNEIYLIEVNPRAARTVPFVSKATGIPLANIAAKLMLGQSLAQFQLVSKKLPYFSVKEVVLPFNKFHGVDPIRGPEMRSTGEAMGIGHSFAQAYAKAQWGAHYQLPNHGRVLLSVKDSDKERIVDLARQLIALGFTCDATHGTYLALQQAGLPCRKVNKVFEGRPHILDSIKNGEYSYIVNTTAGRQAIEDSKTLRRGALQYKANYTTTLNAAFATCQALQVNDQHFIYSIQELHKRVLQ